MVGQHHQPHQQRITFANATTALPNEERHIIQSLTWALSAGPEYQGGPIPINAGQHVLLTTPPFVGTSSD